MLADLRQKIDTIDDAILSLLIERTQIVEEVGKLKAASGGTFSFIRPGREASMVRRLIERMSSPFPKAAIAALWRIIISASLNIEQKLQVSVHLQEGNANAYWYSREYFGSFTQVSTHHTALQVIRDLSQDKANVGVLFLPQSIEADPWWSDFNPLHNKLYIFAHIPFIHSMLEKTQPELPRLVAIAKVTPEETGDDKTLLSLSISASVSQGKILKLFEQAGIEAELLASHDPKHHAPDTKNYLLEIKGFWMESQPTLAALVSSVDKQATVTLLGTYAIPVAI